MLEYVAFGVLALQSYAFANYQIIVTGSGCGIAQPFHVVQTSSFGEVNMSIPCSLITINRVPFPKGKPIPIVKDSKQDLSNSEKEALAHEGETTNQDVNEATTTQAALHPSGIASGSENSGTESGEGSSSTSGGGPSSTSGSISSGSGSGSGTSVPTSPGSGSGSGGNGATMSPTVSGSGSSGSSTIGSGSGSGSGSISR